jgi:DNA-directed RNA polymerase I subunit RPA1
MRQITNEMKGQANEFGYRQRNFDDLQTKWVELQGAVNALIDRDANPVQGRAAMNNADGIKQVLEKKEGLFRKNMMGKRVNFAARSVISPDPNIETNEIGVPPVFAMKLTYPEPVTNHNFYDLKEAVLNGPDKWPGAHAIENEFGQVISLKKKTYEERVALANQLLAPSNVYSNFQEQEGPSPSEQRRCGHHEPTTDTAQAVHDGAPSSCFAWREDHSHALRQL